MATNRGLLVYFLPLIAYGKLCRGRPYPGTDRLDLGGWSGDANLKFTGPGGANFFLEINPKFIRVDRGLKAEPDGTVTMSVDEFFRLLSNQTSFSTAMMTGKIHIEGEGHLMMLVGTLVSQFKSAAMGNLPGILKNLGPLWTRWVLRFSKTGYELPAATRPK